MLASTSEVPLVQPDFVYEPKYDGVRTIAYVSPGRPVPEVRLFSRLGNDKTAQFPAVAKALARFALKVKQRVVLDGEIVALDERQRPVGFQHLQGRIHMKSVDKADDTPTAFIAFDVIADGPARPARHDAGRQARRARAHLRQPGLAASCASPSRWPATGASSTVERLPRAGKA